jgi:hypothetical protein
MYPSRDIEMSRTDADVGSAVSYCGRPVDLDRYPAGGGPRFDQFERCVAAGVGEQPHALADDHGADEQVELIDEVVVEQPPDQGAAAPRACSTILTQPAR